MMNLIWILSFRSWGGMFWFERTVWFVSQENKVLLLKKSRRDAEFLVYIYIYHVTNHVVGFTWWWDFIVVPKTRAHAKRQAIEHLYAFSSFCTNRVAYDSGNCINSLLSAFVISKLECSVNCQGYHVRPRDLYMSKQRPFVTSHQLHASGGS